MKTIIAGGRDYHLTSVDIQLLDKLNITEVVSGMCKGADKDGEDYGDSIGVPIKHFEAYWTRYGGAAGPIRNRQMAEYADSVVLFPGDKGTASMFKEATIAGIIIYDYRKITPL